MNKSAARTIRKGLLAITLMAGAGACYAQNAARAELSAEAGGKGSKVSASLETFAAPGVEINQMRGYSQTLSPAILFLKTYYQHGRNGQRDELLKLYAPEMQAALGRQFADTKSVVKSFADLGNVDVDSALSWGNYRVVLVNHHSKANPQQVFPWVHTISCQSRCMFVDEPELVQKASYLFYLTQFGTRSAAAGAPAAGNLKLALHPVFSDKAPVPGMMSDPVELNLVEADAAAKGAGTALLAKLLKYPNAGAALAAAEKDLFDRGTPKAYPRKAGYGKTTDMVAWEAYLEGVRKKTWTPAHTFRLRADTAILIARSAENDVLFLPFHQVGNGWRLYTTPGEAAFWPLFEGRPFAEAFGKPAKKP